MFFWKDLKDYVADWLQNEDTDTVNGRRTEILRHCFEKGISERGIFQLTVPTGGGKTNRVSGVVRCSTLWRIVWIV